MLDGHTAQIKVTQFIYASLIPLRSYEPIRVRLDVLPFIGPKILLGDDFLNLNKVVMDYKTQTIVFSRLRPIVSGTNLAMISPKRTWGTPMLTVRGVVPEYEDVEAEDDKLRTVVPAEYHYIIDVFRGSQSKHLPPNRPYDHPIDLNPDQKIETPSKV